QRAIANVNCRILPGHSAEEIRQKVIEIVADPKVTVRYVSPSREVLDKAPADKAPAPPDLRPDVMQPLQAVVKTMWEVPIVPGMHTGSSDAVFTNAAGMPTYGITPIGIDVDDVRAHGRDERVRATSFYKGLDFYYRYLKALTGAPANP